MPTINQLVRKGRQTSVTKSTAPAYKKDITQEKKFKLITEHHKKEVYVQLLKQLLLKNLTQL